MFFTARFARDPSTISRSYGAGAEFAERTYVFFSAERAEKKRSYIVMAVKVVAAHIITRL